MQKHTLWKHLERPFYTILAIFLTALILLYPSDSLHYALTGLTLWFDKMIPVLFPFMVLSGIMIRMGLTDSFSRILKPVLLPLFRLSPSCLYVIIIGFLCGFPMGAHVTAQLYERGELTKPEASLLLSFCNNIGPVYFLSFALPSLSLSVVPLPDMIRKTFPAFFLFGMYGLPLFYGLILRYTLYRKRIPPYSSERLPSASPEKLISLPQALDEAVFSSLNGIARLGGYMVFFNLLFLVPALLTRHLPTSIALLLRRIAGCILEITGGICLMDGAAPFFVLCLLPFGGLSCIAQTYSMIHNTDLSLSEYIMHKCILTAITVLYYSLLIL